MSQKSINQEMRVIKRNGSLEDVAFDKILNRIKKIGQEVDIQINYSSLAMKVIDQLYDKIPTTKIDELTAEHCAFLSSNSHDYGILAGRICVSNLHKNTSGSFYETMEKLYNFKELNNDKPLISHELWKTIQDNKDFLDEIIVYDRDYLIEFFGLKTLEKSYLFKIGKDIIERPQHMWLRVSLGIHQNDMEAVKETYDLMSQKYFTHATPTLFNAGTSKPQLSSCFLVQMEEDSLEGIFNTLQDCAKISKWAGGIGLHIHNIRANNSHISGTNGKSSGIVPMLKVYNDTARFINQGGKRNGSFAIYLETWHPDIEDFLEMKKNHGDEEMRARDLFYALWVSDLFMERVKSNSKWSYLCPNDCPGLSDVYGDEFKILYEKYEVLGKARNIVNARDLWFKILDSQMETGTPYLAYKDAANKKTNQQNLGTIKSSNLCCEIFQYTSEKETAVCNLASIALPSFVDKETKKFDYEKLHYVAKVATNNLNKVIDINFYPTTNAKRSNLLHRPIGLGVQGLADTFILMDVAYHSEEAIDINKLIFETIYHACLEKSNELAIERKEEMREVCNKITTLFKKDFDDDTTNIDPISDLKKYLPSNLHYLRPVFNEVKSLQLEHAGSYSSFENSPLSKGIFQFDMWNITPSTRYNWSALKKSIVNNGIRNSLLTALMPTASTSQILGFNECFEPLTSNIYSRRTMAGEFVLANKYLMNDLSNLGLWDENMKNNIIANNGSISHLTNIPIHIRNKYKIVWEIPMKHLIDLSADRGAYICQSQSLNLWVEDPNYNTLTSMHFYAWTKGLKTGIYYLRRKGKHQAQQFTIEPEKNIKVEEEPCEMCSA